MRRKVKKAAARGEPDHSHSRPPLQRMLKIHSVLQAGKYPNASSLSIELDVCSKSIHRDLIFMRDRLQLPIQWDGSKFGYFYTQEVNAFPTMQITEGELISLVVAEKALQQYRGTTFEKPLLSALRKMEQSLPETVSINMSEIENTISFQTRAEPIIDLPVLETLTKATATHQQLELAYRKPGQKQTEQRVVDPYHLANINGEWFLFAYDHLRSDIRTFVPARIKRIRHTGKIFPRPQKFSLERRLRDSFGVQSGKDVHEVVIHFAESAADYIREKKWHSSQRLKELKDGGVELTMNLSSINEVERWVLGWGGKARVLQPPELVKAIKAAANRLLQ
jgi:predicted DNA-binding transcriptional regulator YafY